MLKHLSTKTGEWNGSKVLSMILEGVSGQFHTPATFVWGKYPITNLPWGWADSTASPDTAAKRKISPTSRNQPWSSSQSANHFTNSPITLFKRNWHSTLH